MSDASATLGNKAVKYGILAIAATLLLVDFAYAVQPIINTATDSPGTVESGENVTITANVTDVDGDLDFVWVDIEGANNSMTGTYWPNVTLQPGSTGKDSYINNGSSGTNYGSDTTLLLDQGNGVENRTLIQFGLTAYNGYTISSAYLELYQNDSQAGYRVNASRINQSWVETGVTWDESDNSGMGTAWTEVILQASMILHS